MLDFKAGDLTLAFCFWNLGIYQMFNCHKNFLFESLINLGGE